MALPLLLKAALPSVPVVNLLPGVRKTGGDLTGLSRSGEAVTIERGQVDAYAGVCGFPAKDTVPLPFPHLLAFPLQMAIMTDPGFPAPAIGTVHLENSITAHRPIAIGETVAVSATVGAPKAHPKGTVYDFVSVVTADGEIVWEETSSYLRRGKGDDSASSGSSYLMRHPTAWSGSSPPTSAAATPRCRATTTRSTYALTAKALGFPRQIAHGMWTLARCVAALENRLPDAVRVDVAFKKPVLLPGSVAFGSAPVDGGYAFSLTDPKNRAHLAGRTTSL